MADLSDENDSRAGSGHIAADMRAFDWATTPLGPMDGWPDHLKSEIARWLGAESERAAAVEREAGPASTGASARGAARSTRLLVVEDDGRMRGDLERALRPVGTVEFASDGRAALEAIAREVPDLVVSEMLMPGLDGPALVRAIRTDPRTQTLPVILLSANDEEASPVQRDAAEGADDYIVKPVSARELVARVRAQLQLARQRHEAVDALRESERSRTELFESMIEAYCVIEMIFDQQGRPTDFRYLETNPAFVRHATQPMLGKRIKEVVPDFEQFWLDQYGRVALTGESVELEHVVAGLGDQWFHTSAFRIGGEGSRRVGVVFENITQRKRSEEALRESESRLRAVVEKAPIAIALTGRSGEILLRNPRFDQLWGRPPHVTTATSYSDVYEGYHLDGRPIASEEWPGARALLKGETIDNEVYEIVRADGRRIPCWFGATPILNSSAEIVGAVVVFRDVTEERRTEEALRSANANLAEADRRKDEFIAVLSHELRNPLAPIRYALPLLADEALGARGRRAAAVVERQVAHLVRLVDDLLDVSRISTGKTELRLELVALGAVVATAVEAASPAVAAARHRLEVVVPDDPLWVHVDPARISQAITNLLNNSAKYTPQGGRIRLEATADETSVTIRVLDDGIGLDREALTSVFEMFRQGGDRNGSQGGLGVGLTLAKQLVEMHGGSIVAHSEGKGRGAEFAIRLPLASATASGGEPAAAETARQRARLKVLVVDDNVDLVEMLSLVVEAAGHDVRKAFDGRSSIAAAVDYRPDLILLDVGMPDINGLEVARQLRRQAALSATQIVALTGWGQPEDRRRTAQAGFDHHLTKPADPEQIQRILDEVVQRLTSTGAD